MSETTLVTNTPVNEAALQQASGGLVPLIPGLLLTAGVTGLAFALRRIPGLAS